MRVLARRGEDEAAARLAAGVAAYALKVSIEDVIESPRGSADVAFARRVAMYLCHIGFELSLARVAAAFGRDRSTVAYACHAIEDRREDGRFDAWITRLERMVRGAPPARR